MAWYVWIGSWSKELFNLLAHSHSNTIVSIDERVSIGSRYSNGNLRCNPQQSGAASIQNTSAQGEGPVGPIISRGSTWHTAELEVSEGSLAQFNLYTEYWSNFSSDAENLVNYARYTAKASIWGATPVESYLTISHSDITMMRNSKLNTLMFDNTDSSKGQILIFPLYLIVKGKKLNQARDWAIAHYQLWILTDLGKNI